MSRLLIASIVIVATLVAARAQIDVESEACGAARAKALVGKMATPAIIARIKTASGATATRVIRPNMAVTMDYSPSRLNIELDAKGRVKALRCY